MNTAVNPPRHAGLRCPGCLTPIGAGGRYCRSCGIWLGGPQAAELRWIDAELARVDSARTWLISRRALLLDELIRLRRRPAVAVTTVAEAAPASAFAAGVPPLPHAAEPPVAAAPAPRQRPEMSGRTAARLLLSAGAAMVAIAIAIFTVADWGRIGPLGRCAIPLAVTAAALAAPRVLLRRGLRATAEAVAATGLVLTVGDTYLIHRFTGLRIAPLTAAALCAVGAGAWAGYGRAIKLRGPRLGAIGLVQAIAPLAFVSIADLTGGPAAPSAGPAAGLIVTAAADVLLAGKLSRHRAAEAGDAEHSPPRYTDGQVAAVAAILAWACGVLAALLGLGALISWQVAGHGASWSDAAWLVLVFWAAAAVAGAGPSRGAHLTALARTAAVAAGALAGIGLAAGASPALSASWDLACGGACGLIVGVTALLVSPGPGRSFGWRRDFAAGSAALLALAVLVAAPSALAGLTPSRPVLPAWSGSGRAEAALAIWPWLPAAITVLALWALACLLALSARAGVPARYRSSFAAAGIIAAALAAGALPAAAGLTGWVALSILTAAALIALSASAMFADRTLAGVAVGCASALALTAAGWSLAGRATTLAELGALTVAFALAAALARHTTTAVVATSGALAAAVGLAWAAPLAAGWSAQTAALPGLGIAVAAVAVATALRRARPVHAVVLDVGACLAALLAVVVAARRQDIFAAVTVTAALVAAGLAWTRSGRQRAVAAATAVCAAMTAVIAQAEPLSRALVVPARFLAHPWRQPGQAAALPHPAGLPLAVLVLTLCLAALAAAAGAWRDSRSVSMDALALALPLVAAPAGLACLDAGISYLAVVGGLLVLTLALTAWAALRDSLVAAGAALMSAMLVIAWALAERFPTLAVLGILAAGYGLCAWRSRLPVVRIAASCLSVLSAAAFAEAAALAGGPRAWQAGLAALAVAAIAQVAAARIARGRLPGWPRMTGLPEAGESGTNTGAVMSLGVEISGWLVAATGTEQCFGQLRTASAGTAVAGLICLGVAARAKRRVALWPGLALCYAAWCTGLVAAGVTGPEPYTVPAALIAVAAGWRARRRDPRTHSWLAYGPGLALALMPSLVVAWDGTGWIRPALLGLAAIAIAVAGARARMQAPLLTGIAVALLEAGRQLAPEVMRLVQVLPGWIPIAGGGAALLWAGATYEARLQNIRTIRRSLAEMN